MSVREGTRRKKISVLHMLGTWEGKIEGCNCPSCKEYDEEQLAAGPNRSSSKVLPKNLKGAKVSPKKTVIKVKTTKLVVDVGTGDVIGRKLPDKKSGAVKVEDDSSSLMQNLGDGEVCHSESDTKNERKHIEALQARPFEPSSVNMKSIRREEKELSSLSTSRENEKQKRLEEKMECDSDYRSHSSSNIQKLLCTLPNVKHQNSSKQTYDTPSIDSIQIKEEPEDFFSDDEFEREESGKFFGEGTKSDSRAKKRARMVTSEVENIYAKPRMVFTGRGVVKKFEPGLDKTPKSRRGRKPSKNVSAVKVKQEPQEEKLEENELDQLQQALNEAAENLDVGDDLLDALREFDEDPKESKGKKKSKLKVLKRVESDGDKYVECNMCFKMLKESSMKQHYKTHSGEKPHTCDECDARFTRKGDVERHKRLVHKNQKPFKCRKCKRNFSDRKNLKLHLQNHDKAIYYACETCGFKFGKQEYYENHIRYIHPLPDGSMPVFGDFEQDAAMEQLQEIENEEKKEKMEKEGKMKRESILTVKSEYENASNELEEDATEITVTEGAEEHPKLSKGDSKTTLENSNGDIRIDQRLHSRENHSVNGQPGGTDIRVSKGTLSFTQTVSDTGSQDEDLVNKVIADAVTQAANTIESLQSLSGANLSGNDLDLDDDDDDDDEDDDDDDEDDLLEDEDFQEILSSDDYDIIPVVEQKPVEQLSEIHISASVGGQKRKFIIQVQSGSNLNVQTPDGMEMIVNMVNQLCGGKDELDGPIEIMVQNPGTKAVFE